MAAAEASLPRLRLAEDAWSRVLIELVYSGLLHGALDSAPHLANTLLGLKIKNPASLVLTRDDWALGENFVVPRGDTPAAKNTRKALAPIKFLHAATLEQLELEEAAPDPWRIISKLSGALGACVTNKARLMPTSNIQVLGRKLWEYLSDSSSTPASVAITLREEMDILSLPPQLAAEAVSEHALMLELLDAIQFRASDAGRVRVIEKRILNAGAR